MFSLYNFPLIRAAKSTHHQCTPDEPGQAIMTIRIYRSAGGGEGRRDLEFHMLFSLWVLN